MHQIQPPLSANQTMPAPSTSTGSGSAAWMPASFFGSLGCWSSRHPTTSSASASVSLPEQSLNSSTACSEGEVGQPSRLGGGWTPVKNTLPLPLPLPLVGDRSPIAFEPRLAAFLEAFIDLARAAASASAAMRFGSASWPFLAALAAESTFLSEEGAGPSAVCFISAFTGRLTVPVIVATAQTSTSVGLASRCLRCSIGTFKIASGTSDFVLTGTPSLSCSCPPSTMSLRLETFPLWSWTSRPQSRRREPASTVMSVMGSPASARMEKSLRCRRSVPLLRLSPPGRSCGMGMVPARRMFETM
mmetsp:Transcript_42103/g.124922  ORF Transcript_42103/g.124922 Transcript_42103/m.124922 type:complete len:302 (+) Transcript_42103:463-1368(+)